MKSILPVLLTLGLAACGGSDGGSSGLCAPVGGGASTVMTTPAPTASFSNADRAFDGDLGTAATLNTPGGTGSSTIRGTMQPGVVQASGSYPGVNFRGTISSNLDVTVTTYLDGAEQESGLALTTVSTGDSELFGRQVASAYDAIEITFNLAGDDGSLQIIELCLGDRNFR